MVAINSITLKPTAGQLKPWLHVK